MNILTDILLKSDSKDKRLLIIKSFNFNKNLITLSKNFNNLSDANVEEKIASKIAVLAEKTAVAHLNQINDHIEKYHNARNRISGALKLIPIIKRFSKHEIKIRIDGKGTGSIETALRDKRDGFTWDISVIIDDWETTDFIFRFKVLGIRSLKLVL